MNVGCLPLFSAKGMDGIGRDLDDWQDDMGDCGWVSTYE